MRIRQIHIDGFGQFADKQFGPLERPVTVIYGPNEAGKSTLLEFVRRVLFGYPRRIGKVNAYPALAGGSYGGRTTIEGSDGRMYDVRRTKRRSHSEEVSLTLESGERLSETELTRLLGNHPRNVFEQVFAFTLDELYSDDLLSKANVNSQIYSAGMGVTSLQDAMNAIDGSRNDLFRKRGSTQEIYAAANRLDEIDSTLQEVADNATRYGELTARQRQVEADLEALAARRRENQSQYNSKVMLQNAWDAWNDAVSAEQDLAALPVIDDFPADGANRLEALEERVRTTRREYDSTGLRVAEAGRAADVRVEHEDILKHSLDIRGLERGRTSFDNSVQDLPDRKTEFEGHKRTLADTLRDLGPDWDETRIETFDLPITASQEIGEYGIRLQESAERFRQADSNVQQAEAALKAGGKLTKHESILTYSDDIRALERGRTSFDNSVHDLPEREAELEGYERNLSETLRDLGPDWNEVRLETFDLSIAVREEIIHYQERLQDATGELDRRGTALAQAKTSLKDAVEEENKAEQDLNASDRPSLNAEQIRDQHAQIRAMDSRLRQIQSVQERVTTLQDQLSSLVSRADSNDGRKNAGKVVATVGVLAGITVLAGASALLAGVAGLDDSALIFGIVCIVAGLVIGIAAYLFKSSLSSSGVDAEAPTTSPLRESLKRAETELTDHRSALKLGAASLEIETINATSLITAEGVLDDDEASIRAWDDLSGVLDRARELAGQRKRQADQAKETLDAAREQHEAVQEAWKQWLQARELRDTFVPDTVVELRGKVELGITHLSSVRTWRQRIKAIEKDIGEYAEAVEPLATAFDVPFNSNDLRTVAGVADILIELHGEVERKVRARTGAEEELEKARHQLVEREKHRDAVQLKWEEWLRAHNLQDSLTPETVVRLQEQIKTARSHHENVRSWQQRIKAIEKDIKEYVEAVEPLSSAFDVTFDRNDARTVAAAADRLVELLKEVQERVRKREGAEAELEDAELRLEERRNELQKAEEELGQLLRSGGAENAEDFRVRAGLSERRGSLEEKVRNAHDRLQRLSGPGESLVRLKAELANTDPQSIDDAIAALGEEQAVASAGREELSTERGSIRAELDRLVGEEESSRLRMERNVLMEQIKGHARDWARLTLAQNLLEEARRKFERERQPGVVRHAEKFFTEITEGRYRQVYAPLGEQTITVTDADGRTKQPSELSRGTREQLFLSLRFGLIRELGERTEPLPVVVDEILVNFDPDRALRAAVAFTELSSTNQVLVFTCHPTVVELFRNAASEAGTDEPDLVTFS